jgi:translation initiation factor IF-3
MNYFTFFSPLGLGLGCAPSKRCVNSNLHVHCRAKVNHVNYLYVKVIKMAKRVFVLFIFVYAVIAEGWLLRTSCIHTARHGHLRNLMAIPHGKVRDFSSNVKRIELPKNSEIKVDPVRLIAPKQRGAQEDSAEEEEEEMLGIFSLTDALSKAESMELDLVLINEKGDPPVCKIVDYGKYRYLVEKRKKEKSKKQTTTELKEVKMSYKIDAHDLTVRLKAAQKFIAHGDRVRILNDYVSAL